MKTDPRLEFFHMTSSANVPTETLYQHFKTRLLEESKGLSPEWIPVDQRLQALKDKKPFLIYVDLWSTERIRNEKMIMCHGSVAPEQERSSRAVPRVPYVELTPELLAVLDSLYPEGFIKPQGG